MSPDGFDPNAPLIRAASLLESPSAPFLILGVTADQRAFRPSDWADRLAGVMSAFQPSGRASTARFQYSPYALPARHATWSCVRVDPALRQVEPMALDFLMNFARDNDLMLIVATPGS
jgi:hypothetical protein